MFLQVNFISSRYAEEFGQRGESEITLDLMQKILVLVQFNSIITAIFVVPRWYIKQISMTMTDNSRIDILDKENLSALLTLYIITMTCIKPLGTQPRFKRFRKIHVDQKNAVFKRRFKFSIIHPDGIVSLLYVFRYMYPKTYKSSFACSQNRITCGIFSGSVFSILEIGKWLGNINWSWCRCQVNVGG